MMGGYGDVKLLNDDGTRLDGRAIDEMRPLTAEVGVLPAADGSAMVTHGLNVAIAAVYGPVEDSTTRPGSGRRTLQYGAILNQRPYSPRL